MTPEYLAMQARLLEPPPAPEPPPNPLAHSEEWSGAARYYSDPWLHAQGTVILWLFWLWIGGGAFLLLLAELFGDGPY